MPKLPDDDEFGAGMPNPCHCEGCGQPWEFGHGEPCIALHEGQITFEEFECLKAARLRTLRASIRAQISEMTDD